MAIKIDSHMSATAFHIRDGATLFPYAIDAQHAVSNHPGEWRMTPWSAADTIAARNESGDQEQSLTAEEQVAIEEHAKVVAEANERLQKFRAEQEEKRQIDEQIKQDELLVASAPPVPVRRPFGRTGEPTPAELEQIKKREAKKADDERIKREKAEADAIGNAVNATIAE
jgi:hypothetical protein